MLLSSLPRFSDAFTCVGVSLPRGFRHGKVPGDKRTHGEEYCLTENRYLPEKTSLQNLRNLCIIPGMEKSNLKWRKIHPEWQLSQAVIILIISSQSATSRAWGGSLMQRRGKRVGGLVLWWGQKN